MNDDLGLFSDDADEPLPYQRGRRSRRAARESRERQQRRRRSRTLTALGGVFVLLLVAAGVAYGSMQLLQIGWYDDYQGGGAGTVVVEIKAGDSTSEIGQTLVHQDVVASTKAFTKAAQSNPGANVNDLQPGFYLMRHRMSGESAVRRITSPDAKVGRLEVRAGTRLEDQTGPDGHKVPGIFSQMAAASCTNLDGHQQCLTTDQLRQLAATADLGSLGVPNWAVGPASKAEPSRRLEGLIAPGVYDVRPGEPPDQLLRSVLTASAAQFQAAGLPQIAEGTGYGPYEVLIIGSLSQSEAVEKDLGKVSRVIETRLSKRMPLQFDSTINYPLDKPTLLTNDADRARPGPYNTYINVGLPPTPISAMSKEAIMGAAKPAPGDWLYFVKCYPDGTSCFSQNQAQHEQAIRDAQARGAY